MNAATLHRIADEITIARMARMGGPAARTDTPTGVLPRGDRGHAAPIGYETGWTGQGIGMEGHHASGWGSRYAAEMAVRGAGGDRGSGAADFPGGRSPVQGTRGWVAAAERIGEKVNRAPRLSWVLFFVAVSLLVFDLLV